MKLVRVIGGGFTGTLTAYLLMRKGFQVELVERTDRFGGIIGTETTEHGARMEWAAHGFLSNHLLESVADDIGVELVPAGPVHSKKYFFIKDKVCRWPLGFFASLTSFFRFSLCFAAGKAKPRAYETLLEWGNRVFGDVFTENVLRVAVVGIYAAPLERLSATLVMGRLFGGSRSQKSGSRSRFRGTVAPARGMDEWISKLVQALRVGGARLNLNASADLSANPDFSGDSSSPLTIVCAHLKDIPKLLMPVDPQWASAFLNLASPGALVVSMFFDEHPDQLRGFGVLFHPKAGFLASGCLFESDCFPETQQNVRHERYILSESAHPNLFALSDDQLLNRLLKDRIRFSPSQRLLSHKIHKTPQGFPLYSVELERRLSEVPLQKQNIILHGNFTGRLGLAQIAVKTQELVDRLAVVANG